MIIGFAFRRGRPPCLPILRYNAHLTNMKPRFFLALVLFAAVAQLFAQAPQAYVLYTGALQGQLEPCG